MKFRKVAWFVFVMLIITLSFSLFSSRFYPNLNSDDALNILMTHYYSLPHDLYCWGQDRGGTLIPLIGQLFHRILGFSATNSVSFANYLILILGFIGFSGLLKNRLSKIIFAIIWFFPAIRFIDLLRFPIGVEYSLIGFSIYLIRQIDIQNRKPITNHLLMSSTVVVMILSVWVSDIAILTIMILLGVLLAFHFAKTRQFRIRSMIYPYILLGLVAGFLFIRFAKSNVTNVNSEYLHLNSFEEILNAILIWRNELILIFTFQTREVVFSVFAWMALILAIALVGFSFRQYRRLSFESKKWLTFFALDLLAMMGVLIVSHWVYLNHLGRWYFISVYISLSLILLVLFDRLEFGKKWKTAIQALLIITTLTGAASTLHSIQYIHPKSFRSEISSRRVFLSLGSIGIISNFWNSYITSCVDPDIIKATPHDRSSVRNQTIVDEVFEQSKIYVISDGWLDSFPDTLLQFGYALQKKGESFVMAGCKLNEYSRIKRKQFFKPGSFNTIPETTRHENSIEIPANIPATTMHHVVWGPYTYIGQGKYVAGFMFEFSKFDTVRSVVTLYVRLNHGDSLAGQRTIKGSEIKPNGVNKYEVSFGTLKRYRIAEFAVYSHGNSEIVFHGVELKEE